MTTIILSASVSVFFFILSLYSFRDAGMEDIGVRLNNFKGEGEDTGSGKSFKKIFQNKDKHKDDVDVFERKDGWHHRFSIELSRAGIPMRPEEFLAVCAVGGLVTGTLLVMFTGSFLMLLLGLLAGAVVIPYITIRRKKQKRLVLFNQQLAGSLSTMANSMRVGFSLFQAMKTLSEEMSPPISQELSRTLQELNLGARTDDALQNMCERVKSDDLDLIVMAIVIQRQVGGNLAEVLDNIAHTIRERIRIQREVKTLTAQGRISGLVIGLLPMFLAVIIYFINPAYISVLFTHPIGQMLILIGLVSQVIGVLLIRKVVNIEM